MKNCLVDTHVLIWMLYEPNRLHRSVGLYLRDPHTKVNVTAVSIWEISIKHGLKKLPYVDLEMSELLDTLREQNITLIELSPEEAASSIILSNLPAGTKWLNNPASTSILNKIAAGCGM